MYAIKIANKYHITCATKPLDVKKGAEAPFLVAYNLGCMRACALSSYGAEHTKRIRPAKAVTLTGLVSHVTGVEITIH